MTAFFRFSLLILVMLCLASCSDDPKLASLKKGVWLMESIVTSRVLIDAVKNADPQMRASTAVGAALSGGITANFPRPPDGIGVSNEGAKPTESWMVHLVADDTAKQIRIEGYGDNLQEPLIIKKIDFPPK
ncbi:MAG: hypothetical protein H6R18_1506 [Proteobacteria bacterium]|nr:hypothetical protein [Pseudomonadota bacterium]